MMLPSRHFDFATGAWTKRAIRKADDEDEDRKLAERIASEVLPGRPLEQKELAAWLRAKPSRLRRLQRDREAAQRVDALELRSTGKAFTMNRSEHLRAVVKSAGGVTALCKRIVKDGGAGDISEHELTGLIVTAAKVAQPDLSDAQAFSRMFTDMSPAGEAMRRAITIAKAGPLPDEEREDEEEERERDEGRDDDDAMDELHAKANELRKRLPHLSPEQCFAKVYEDPANRRLAARERKQNSPLRRVV
jgi:hypothetical protein